MKAILRVFGLYAQDMGMNEKVVSSQICFLPKVAVKQGALVPGRLETFGGMMTTVMIITVVVAATRIIVTTIIFRVLIRDWAPAASFISGISRSSRRHLPRD